MMEETAIRLALQKVRAAAAARVPSELTPLATQPVTAGQVRQAQSLAPVLPTPAVAAVVLGSPAPVLVGAEVAVPAATVVSTDTRALPTPAAVVAVRERVLLTAAATAVQAL